MATSVEPDVADPPEEVLLCLDCNYSLKGLPQNRCPECGRQFNLDDSRTFNSERPLRWIDRQLLKPIGWPMFTSVALLSCGYLYLGFFPKFYYAIIPVIVTFLLCVVVAMMLIVRNLLRAYIPPRSIFRSSSIRREKLAFAILAIPFLLVIFQVPLRIVFFLARPELDRVAKGIIDGTISRPVNSHRAGPITISSAMSLYGDDDQYFFLVHGFGGGGFAYCRTPGRPLYYNSGADGHLWGNWYWWIDD
jgi:hypothetical protein